MFAKTRLFVLFACVSTLTACFREDDKITLPPPGEAQVAQVGMGSTYDNQIFFSLRNGVMLTNSHAAWDLAFESSAEGYHIWINGGKDMLVARTYSANFYGITSYTGWDYYWDESSWNPDSTAIGDWVGNSVFNESSAPALAMRTNENEVYSNGRVYIIDRGITYTDVSERYWKVVFQSYSPTAYTFKYGKMDNSFVDSIVLEKNPQEAYTYFTFDDGGHNIVMEPKPVDWDFVFTRYRYIFYNTNPYTPYLVSGVLLNPQGIAAALDSTATWENVDVNVAQQMILKTQRDVIGWNWKGLNFSTFTYETKSEFIYVIRDREGYYWKLRFLDFYNDQGEKGFPKFEFQRL